MGIFKLGAIITDASGKLGGQTVQRNGSSIIIKNKSATTRKKTLKQSAVRLRTNNLMSRWSDLTNEQQKAWFVKESIYTKTDVFGTVKPLEGFYLFQSINQNRKNTNQSFLSVPAQHHIPTYPQYINVVATPTSLQVQSFDFNSDDIIHIYATKNLSNGISKPKRYFRKIASMSSGDLAAGEELISDYNSIFTDLKNNDKIFIAIKTFSAVSGFSNGKVIQASNQITVSGSAPTYSTEYQAILNEASTLGYGLPNDTDKTIQNNIIVALKASGFWTNSDALFYFNGSGDSLFKSINWRLPTGIKATVNGSMNYAANGVKGDNATPLLLNYVASSGLGNWLINSASIAVQVNEASVNGIVLVNMPTSTGSKSSVLFNQNNFQYINSSGNGARAVQDLSGTGFKIEELTAGSMYRSQDGIIQQTQAGLTPDGVPNGGTQLFKFSTSLNGDPRIGLIRFGSGLSGNASNHLALYNNLVNGTT